MHFTEYTQFLPDQDAWDKPLTKEILSDPNHFMVMAILNIPCLEDEVFQWMIHYQRQKTEKFIPYLGAYAFALG